MIKKILLFIFALAPVANFAYADDYAKLVTYRDSLKQQITAIDSEITRCEKTTKGWQAATIVGGITAVASGIGIAVQNQQVKENNQILQDISAEAKKADLKLNLLEGVK